MSNSEQSSSFFSTHRNSDLINRATLKLLDENIEYLIKNIYDPKNEKSIFGHPEARIGLSLKLLHGTSIRLDKPVLDPIMDDIEMLMDSDDYLESTGNPEKRRKCLQEELKFVYKYLDMDDTISLNTLYTPRLKKRQIPSQQETGGSSSFFSMDQRENNTRQPPENNNCTLM